MKFLKYPWWLLWRIWFYILVIVPIMVLFPVLIITIAKESWYKYFFKIAQLWAYIILYGMGFWPEVTKATTINASQSYMLVANHTSMLDIMLMLVAVNKPFVFVGKKELAKYPLFGFFYKRTCILVDRSNNRSRHAVYARAQKRLHEGLSICIFPEGRVPDDESIVLDEFKDGAFRLAIEHQIPILPIVFPDNKKRFSYTFFSGCIGKVRALVMKAVETNQKTLDDKNALKNQIRELIYNELIKFEKN